MPEALINRLERKNPMDDQFITKDLYLAGLLYAKNIKLEKVNRNGKLCWFVFNNKSLCEELQQQFFNKAVDVNAKDYVNALRTLKDLIFAEKQNKEDGYETQKAIKI